MSTRNDLLTFGDFIKNYRLGEEMSQTECARFLNISRQRLCDIEKNRFNMSLKLCRKFARKIDVPPEWLAKLIIQEQIRKERLKLLVKLVA